MFLYLLSPSLPPLPFPLYTKPLLSPTFSPHVPYGGVPDTRALTLPVFFTDLTSGVTGGDPWKTGLDGVSGKKGVQTESEPVVIGENDHGRGPDEGDGPP